MSTGQTPPPKSVKDRSKKTNTMTITLLVLVALIVAFVFSTQVYTDLLWFNQLGFGKVFITENIYRIAVFLIAAAISGIALWASMQYAYKKGEPPAPPKPRARPHIDPNHPMAGQFPNLNDLFNQNMARYQKTVENARKVLLFVVPVALGLFVGIGAASQWKTIALFFHKTDFGTQDPEFGLDYGFFVFTLPFLQVLTTFLSSITVLAAVGALVMHYFYGGIKVLDKGIETSKAFRKHMAVLAALYLLIRGVNFWLERYSATQDQSGNWAGAMYTDVNAIIPVKAILAIAAVLVAAFFAVAAVTGRWRLPMMGTAVILIVGLVAGGVYPWIIQRFQVVPNEQASEAQYIQRNIDATRSAYGLDNIETKPYDATTNTAAGALKGESQTVSNIRLLDPNVVSDAFAQLQQFRPYYRFENTLSVDRYKVDGVTQDTVIAPRELNPAQNAGSSWINQHVVYTHGYGVIAAYGNKVEADGKPKFMQSGIQAKGVLSDDYEPRIYFGLSSPSYSIVGGNSGDEALELDRPQTADDSADSDAKYTFTGNGGPNIGNVFNRLAYAIKFQSSDILLSDAVRPESQILYERNPSARIKQVAPYLTVDGNPYPAIVDGRVQWIVDAYTTSDQYPYSQESSLDSATSDSETSTGNQRALPQEKVNYIRNSVKATVDAYDGSVKLYAWDENDPILQSWQKVFPETVASYKDMSAELLDHVRYPQDMFKVQREILNKYHVTDSGSFYAGDDVWSVPNDPTNESGKSLPPYYLSLQMPGEKKAAFALTSSFIPQQSDSNSRNVMYGFLAANGDAGTGKDGVKSDSYGKMTLLELPRSSVVPGPGQAQNVFNSDTEVSKELNLLRQGASQVINGNLLTLPVGDGILYVQPVYVQSSGDAAYPTLRRVLVGFGEKVGFAPTLDEALNMLFGGSSGAKTDADAGVDEKAADKVTDQSGSDSKTSSGDLQSALADANQAMKDADAAMKAGDWTKYGEAQQRLNDAIGRAMEADGVTADATPSAEPTK